MGISHTRPPLYKDERSWNRESRASKSMKAWYSPSHSYLDIKEIKNTVRIGSRLDVMVGYTSVDLLPVERKISYSLMCGGNLVRSESISKVFNGAAPPGYTTPSTTT